MWIDRRFLMCLFLFLQIISSSNSSAQDQADEKLRTSPFYSPEVVYQKERSDFTRPALSLFLPGFDQLISGQFGYGLAYASVALSSLVLTERYDRVVSDYEKTQEFLFLSPVEQENIYNHDDRYRRLRLASQFYLVSGSLSAYHSFRTAALARKQIGEYQFLEAEDSVQDILMAPFNLDYFMSKKTALPLGLLATLVLFANESENYQSDYFTRSDAAFTGAFSYNAGTSEEALFRGWLMPYLSQQTGSLFWSNMIQSSLFALAHTNQTSFPLFQFGLGYYLGWLTQNQGWSIKESIFIHTWWDVIAFAAEYSRKKKSTSPAKVLWLPALRLAF